MVIWFNGITHSARYVVAPTTELDRLRGPWVSCCSIDTPCGKHERSLTWTVGTACGVAFPVTGRPEEGKATCMACIAAT